jgi:uncharacterized protein YndB with AHSA1/START domain
MFRIEDQHMDINASVDRVFSYVTDFARSGEWMNYWPFEFVALSEGPVRIGYSYEWRGLIEPRGASIAKALSPSYVRVQKVTVTEYVPDQRLVLETVAHTREVTPMPLSSRDRSITSFDVEPTDGGTRLNMSVNIMSISKWMRPIWWLLWPLLFRPITKRAMMGNLRRLRERVESR